MFLFLFFFRPENIGDQFLAGNLTIELSTQTELVAGDPSVIVRKFYITNSEERNRPLRTVHQICYEEWPDFGVPESARNLLRVCFTVDKLNKNKSKKKKKGKKFYFN